MYFQTGKGNQINLQSTLSASSPVNEIFNGGPHHPITCQGNLYFEEDETFRCDHAVAAPGDARTKQVLHHSMAILLIELAGNL